MAAPTYDSRKGVYGPLWRSMGVTRVAQADAAVKRILKSKPRYEAVEAQTGVPWFLIAILHMRESSNDFRGVLHNGQKILGTGRKTTIVPKGRGPFSSWEEAAIDAIKLKGLHKIKEWPIERIIYEAERFNGFGYVPRRVNSPYLWAGSNHYKTGKYVADSKFDPNHTDTQMGVMPVLARLGAVDESVRARVKGHPPDEMLIPARLGPTKDPAVYSIQMRLNAMGYSPGGMDGLWGGMTSGAIAAFLNDVPWKPSYPCPVSKDDFDKAVSQINADLAKAEAENWKRPIAPGRANATAKDVAPKIETVTHTWWTRLLVKVGIGTGGTAVTAKLQAVASDADQQGLFDQIVGLIQGIPDWAWLATFVTIMLLIWRHSRKAEQSTIDAYREGRLT